MDNALLKLEKDGVIARRGERQGKKDGDEVRVCDDFSVTYNACANVETT